MRKIFIGVTSLVGFAFAASFSSNNVQTEIDIDASPEIVWGHLTNFDEYSNWNPFIREISGPTKIGSTLQVNIQPSDNASMKFTPTVTVSKANAELRWLGHLLLPKIFDGEHYFIIQQKADGTTRFIQGENFTGILVHPLWAFIGQDTKVGFSKMNHALKTRAEALTLSKIQ